MNQQSDYQSALTSFQNSARTFAKEFSKFCVLLHTRITREVLPALENALAAMGLASQRPVFTNKCSYPWGKPLLLVKDVPSGSPKPLGELEPSARSGQS